MTMKKIQLARCERCGRSWAEGIVWICNDTAHGRRRTSDVCYYCCRKCPHWIRFDGGLGRCGLNELDDKED